MRQFIHIQVSNGEIKQTAKAYGNVPDNLHNTTINDGQTLLYEVDKDLDTSGWVKSKYYRDGEFLAKPPRPSIGEHVFVNYEWQPDLASLQGAMRSQRDTKLLQSDWRMMPDSTLTNDQRAAWTTYRQALRDLPTSYPNLEDMNEITWPTEPS
jgi:hypothetical protein